MTEKVKAVFDSGIVLQAALNPVGPAGQVFALLAAGEIEVYMRPLLRNEIEDILYRPDIRRKYPRLTDGRTEKMLRAIEDLAFSANDGLILLRSGFSREFALFPMRP